MADFVHVDSPVAFDSEPQPLPTQDPLGNSSIPQDPNTAQHDYLKFLKTHPFVRSSVIDKAYGCIIGSALGDTIGLYTEFLPKATCAEVYEKKKFTLVGEATEWYGDSHRSRFERCAWTDDTDQAILILLAHIHTHTTSSHPGLPSPSLSQDFAARLRIWIEQGLRALNRPPCGIGNLVGGVVCSKDYLLNPAETAMKRWVKTARHVAPNGSLMRTHPIGIIGISMGEIECWTLAADVGMTTHADPRCTVACCISSGLIRGLLRGEITTEADIDAAIERAYDWVLCQPHLLNPGLSTELTTWELSRHLDRHEFTRHVYAKTYAELHLDNRKEMGYVYKCLGSAVLTLRLGVRAATVTDPSVLKNASHFEDLMTDLIMEGGDSDTNGAVAGALVGAYLGYANLPAHWALGLAHREWLGGKIMRLLKVVGIVDGGVGQEADERPDGGKGLMGKEELEKRDQDMLALIMRRRKEREEKERSNKGNGMGFIGWFTK